MASGFVIASGNGTKLFEFAEEVLNQMPLLIKFLVMGTPNHSVAFGGNNRRFPGLLQRIQHPFIGVIRFVGKEGLRFNLRSGKSASAPSRSEACPGVRRKPVGFPSASVVA